VPGPASRARPLLLIVPIAWEVLRLTGNAPEFGVKHDVVTAALAGVIALLTLFLVFDVLGDTGIGAWLGVLLLIVLGYVAYMAFAAGGREAVTEADLACGNGATRGDDGRAAGIGLCRPRHSWYGHGSRAASRRPAPRTTADHPR
jgi:hypothetical protein